MISLWNDMNTNNYYLINNETGDKTRVLKTGEYIKEFDASLTGQVGYNERVKKASKPGYLPHKAHSINVRYTDFNPPVTKMFGYAHCPNPVKLPRFEYMKTEKRTQKLQPISRTQVIAKQMFNTLQPTDSKYQSLLDPDQYKSISTIQHQDLNDVNHYKEMSHMFESLSYDYKSFNSPERHNIASKSLKDFELDLKQQQQQLEMFKLPEEKKQTIETKGRFPIQMNSAKDLFVQDLAIAKMLYPDVYKEKPIDEAQEKLRKKINLLKEKEMLDRNLRNKV